MSSAEVFQLGDRVIVDSSFPDPSRLSVPGSQLNQERTGIVRYVGKTSFKEGDWLGVELDTPTGKNDGSVLGVRYFTCKPFHGLFVSCNKARLNLSGAAAPPSSNLMKRPSSLETPKSQNQPLSIPPKFSLRSLAEKGFSASFNSSDKIENFQLDLSAANGISDPFKVDSKPISSHPPPQDQQRFKQRVDLAGFRDQLLSLKNDLKSLSSSDLPAIDSILSKLGDVLDSCNRAINQSEVQPPNSLSSEAQLEERRKLLDELEKNRNLLYSKVQQHEELKSQFSQLQKAYFELEDHASNDFKHIQRLEQSCQQLQIENTKILNELTVSKSNNEMQSRRELEKEQFISDFRKNFESELAQKDLKISDLQNEVELSKQSLKILQEELDTQSSFRFNSDSETSRENQRLQNESMHYKKAANEYKKLYEEVCSAKQKAEDFWRGEIEKGRKSISPNLGPNLSDIEIKNYQKQIQTLSNEKEQLKSKLESFQNSMTRREQQPSFNDYNQLKANLIGLQSDFERSKWSLEASKRENTQLKSKLEEIYTMITEKDKNLRGVPGKSDPENIRKLYQEFENMKVGYENEIKRLSSLVNQDRLGLSVENVNELRRKLSIVGREKELLEDQLRLVKSLNITGVQPFYKNYELVLRELSRLIDCDVLSLEPKNINSGDMIKVKEIVRIIMKFFDDIKFKLLGHLNLAEQNLKCRTPSEDIKGSFVGEKGLEPPATVKIDRTRKESDIRGFDIRKRLDFESSESKFDVDRSENSLTSMNLTNTNLTNTNPTFGSVSSVLAPRFQTFDNSLLNSNDGGFAKYSRDFTSSGSGSFANLKSESFPQDPDRLSQSKSRIETMRNMISEFRNSAQNSAKPSSNYSTSNISVPSRSQVRVLEPIRCNLCNEYGHDALSCPDYLSSAEQDDLIVDNLRSNINESSLRNFKNM